MQNSPSALPGADKAKGKIRQKRKLANKVKNNRDKDDFTLSSKSSQEFLRRTTRTHSRKNLADESSTESEEPIFQNPGPPLEEILAGPPSGAGKDFICKKPRKSYVHLSVYKREDLSAGSFSQAALNRYSAAVAKEFEIVSPLNNAFTQPASKLLDTNVFFVERIIGHKTDEQVSYAIQQHINYEHYLAGLPIDNSNDLTEFDEYRKPMGPVDEKPDMFIQDDGSYFLHETKETQRVDEDQESESLPDDDKPSPKTQFLIKWKGLPLTQSTWETMDSLTDEPYCAANIDELLYLVKGYWKNFKSLESQEPGVEDFDVQTIHQLERGYQLTDGQKETVRSILSERKENHSIILSGEEGSGRVATIVAFLATMRYENNHRKPALVICNHANIEIWEETIRMMTILPYSVLVESVADRRYLKENEILGSNLPKFHILIADSMIIRQESEFLESLLFETIIVDTRLQVPTDAARFFESDAFHIFISNDSFDDLHVINCKNIPFAYKENLLMETNTAKPVLHSFICNFLKSRQTKYSISVMAMELFRVFFASCSHVLLSHQMIEHVRNLYNSKHDLYGKKTISKEDMCNLTAEYSPKLNKLFKLVSQTGVSVVVANELSTLRIIQSFLSDFQLSSIIANSMIIKERPPADALLNENFSAVLMIRNLYSPLLSKIHPSRVIFFDLPDFLPTDINIIHFFTRNSNPEIIRLLARDSLETVIYALFMKTPDLNLSLLTQDDYEIIIRAVTLMSKPGRRTPDTPSEVNFVFPNDRIQLSEDIDSVFENVKSMTNYWEEIYPSPTGLPLRICNWTNAQAFALIDKMCTFDYGNWGSICQNFDHTEEETRDFGRAVFLQHITHINELDHQNYALAAYIAQLEYFGKPYNGQMNDPAKYWSETALYDPFYPSSIFVSKSFQKQLIGNATRLLKNIQQTWIIRTFISLHPEPTLPVRSVTGPRYTPQFVYAIFSAYLSGNISVPMISRIIPDFNNNDFETIFQKIVPALTTEIYMVATAHISNGETNTSDKYLLPLVLSMLHGPFLMSWPQYLVHDVIGQLARIGIPKLPDGTNNWPMFAAIAGIRNKSPQMITTFMEALYGLMLNTTVSREPLVIPTELSLITPTVRIVNGKQELIAISVIADTVIRASKSVDTIQFLRSLLTDGIPSFVGQAFLPQNWTKECDESLVAGIVQYGFDYRGQLALIPYKPYNENYPDFMMKKDLSEFSNFLLADSVSRRLSYLILCFANITRKIKMFESPIRKFVFVAPSIIEHESYMRVLYEEYKTFNFAVEEENFLKEHPDFVEYLERRNLQAKSKSKAKVTPVKKPPELSTGRPRIYSPPVHYIPKIKKPKQKPKPSPIPIPILTKMPQISMPVFGPPSLEEKPKEVIVYQNAFDLPDSYSEGEDDGPSFHFGSAKSKRSHKKKLFFKEPPKSRKSITQRLSSLPHEIRARRKHTQISSDEDDMVIYHQKVPRRKSTRLHGIEPEDVTNLTNKSKIVPHLILRRKKSVQGNGAQFQTNETNPENVDDTQQKQNIVEEVQHNQNLAIEDVQQNLPIPVEEINKPKKKSKYHELNENELEQEEIFSSKRNSHAIIHLKYYPETDGFSSKRQRNFRYDSNYVYEIDRKQKSKKKISSDEEEEILPVSKHPIKRFEIEEVVPKNKREPKPEPDHDLEHLSEEINIEKQEKKPKSKVETIYLDDVEEESEPSPNSQSDEETSSGKRKSKTNGKKQKYQIAYQSLKMSTRSKNKVGEEEDEPEYIAKKSSSRSKKFEDNIDYLNELRNTKNTDKSRKGSMSSTTKQNVKNNIVLEVVLEKFVDPIKPRKRGQIAITSEKNKNSNVFEIPEKDESITPTRTRKGNQLKTTSGNNKKDKVIEIKEEEEQEVEDRGMSTRSRKSSQPVTIPRSNKMTKLVEKQIEKPTKSTRSRKVSQPPAPAPASRSNKKIKVIEQHEEEEHVEPTRSLKGSQQTATSRSNKNTKRVEKAEEEERVTSIRSRKGSQSTTTTARSGKSTKTVEIPAEEDKEEKLVIPTRSRKGSQQSATSRNNKNTKVAEKAEEEETFSSARSRKGSQPERTTARSGKRTKTVEIQAEEEEDEKTIAPTKSRKGSQQAANTRNNKKNKFLEKPKEEETFSSARSRKGSQPERTTRNHNQNKHNEISEDVLPPIKTRSKSNRPVQRILVSIRSTPEKRKATGVVMNSSDEEMEAPQKRTTNKVKQISINEKSGRKKIEPSSDSDDINDAKWKKLITRKSRK